MRLFLTPVFVIMFIALTMMPAVTADKPATPDVGDYFPPFAGNTIKGEDFDLANHYNAGMYIFVDFWASW